MRDPPRWIPLTPYVYTAFINKLITSLERSRLCCVVYGIPSNPLGYADDLATACNSDYKLDKPLKIVNDYGNKWRFKFNAMKSAILVYGEEKKENRQNLENRIFKLGKERVKEKVNYDHVGVKVCLFKDDETRVKENICKGRRALNAAAGLGMRKNGLTIKTCSLIFWTILVPIITFGSEIWEISENGNLLQFQRYAGKRVQRFPSWSPNCSSFFGLGWLRITTYILAKKLIFALTFLRMDIDNIVKSVYRKVFSYYESHWY